MKKREILKLIEYNQTIKKNNNLLSIIKEEFNILEKEIEETLEETMTCKKYIQNNCCNHEVRLEHYGLFCSDYECIFCNKNIIGDNCVNWEYSTNRNKYSVSLVAKYQNDDDYGYISKGYTEEDIYEIIINILKDKEMEEEVDLIKEFKKLNLPNCKVNEEKKVEENYILIIGGSNKQFIDKESYIHKNGLNIGIDFLKYFLCLLNTKIELIDNSENLKDNEYVDEKNRYLKFISYNTIEELERIITNQKEIPFKIIIDISELTEYKINNNEISNYQYNINLSDYFPNSHIIKINNLSKRSLEELAEYLNEAKNIYAYHQQKYYYQENNEIKSENLENTCRRLKLLLKNK